MNERMSSLAKTLGLEVVPKEEGSKTFNEVGEHEIFRGDSKEHGDIRNWTFFRLAQKSTGGAIIVEPPSFKRTQAGSFFKDSDPILVMFRDIEK